MKNLINDQRTMKAYDNDSSKKRSFQHFMPEERGQIQAFLEEGKSMAVIGGKIGKTRASFHTKLKKAKTQSMKNFGHWEADTVIGAQGGGKESIAVFVEKLSRAYRVRKIPDKTVCEFK